MYNVSVKSIRVIGSMFAVVALAQMPLTYADSPPGFSSSDDAVQSTQPLNVIFDTDIWGDIDDMLALAMLHALQDRGEVKLLAVTISTDSPWCASYVDLVNTFYGHPEIPVGIVHGGVTPESFQRNHLMGMGVSWPLSRYTEVISQRKNRDGSPLYPHRLLDGTRAEDATLLLRKTLAAQADGSVVVILVGYSTNMARLLESAADASSPLNGLELVRKKVKFLSVMAARFVDMRVDGKTIPAVQPEYNLAVDIPSARKVFSDWPTPIVDSGTEIGLAMLYPGSSVTHDYAYVEHHPIADSYRTFCEELKEIEASDSKIRHCPQDHDHGTFDLTAVLYAARPTRDYFLLSKPGTITVLKDGSARFQESEGGRHRYLVLREDQKARTLEAMMMLASQPPLGTLDKAPH